MDTTKGPANSIIRRAPGGLRRDKQDDYQARQGRVRHEGFQVQGPRMPLQPPPMFFTHDHHPIPLIDHYKGRSAVLIAGGPSLMHGQDAEFIAACKGVSLTDNQEKRDKIQATAEELSNLPQVYDLKRLYEPGVFTLAMNNACRVIKPCAWSCVDSPSNFIISNWLDPRVMKFAPICHTQKTLFDNAGEWKETSIRTMDCPNMVYYKRNEHFQPSQFLTEDTINWGCSKKNGGGRSIVFASIRILYLLGFRRVFLVGVDMNMDKTNHYAFAQDRSSSSQRGNQSTYQLMKTRFTQLKPHFEEAGFSVFNCNPDSAFKVFPTCEFEEAMDKIWKEEMRCIDFENEKTEGMYDREAKNREKKDKVKNTAAVKSAAENAKKYTEEERKDVKRRLDGLRAELDARKSAVDKWLNVSPAAGTDEEKAKWQQELDILKADVHAKRLEFRTCEDEKRIKWGEPPKWNLWKETK